jgi:P4 family phage/plasmid primase-like protien
MVEELLHVQCPIFEKQKNKLDTFDIHAKLTKLFNDTRVYSKKGENKTYTHTSIPSKDSTGKIIGGGKYNFSNKEHNDQLKEILTQCIEHNYFPKTLSLTQKISTYSCLHIDLDFRYPITTETRQYTQNEIEKLINLFNNGIKEIYNIDDKYINAYIFERKSGVIPDEDKQLVKDGTHIMYPQVITHTKSQYLLRDYVLSNCDDLFTNSFKSTNTVEDIVDKAVIENSNWMIYGARKINRDPYELTYVMSKVKDHKIINTRNLLDYFDFSEKTKEESTEVNEKYKNALETFIVNTSSPKRKTELTNKLVPLRKKINQIADLTEVRMLINILSQERADDHDKWIRTGWCLHNINKDNLLDDWIKFSSKSQKHKIKSIEHGRSPERCMYMWNEMKRQESGLGVGSLHRWAKEDNPKEYEEIRRSNLKSLIRKSASCTTYDVARVVYEMYKYNFKCISYKENKWYEFQPAKHHWVIIEKAHTLIKLISEDVVKQYLKTIYEMNRDATLKAQKTQMELMNNRQSNNIPLCVSPAPSTASSDISETTFVPITKRKETQESDETLDMVENLVAVTFKLRDISFKEKVIKECGTMFGENAKQFLESMDANPYLIGFDNGVYDLQADEFRDGRSEDYITFSTGYDYIDFGPIEGPEIEEEIREIYEFFEQVFPQKSVREYILLLLSSFLGGTTRDEKFHIWTGIGSNGKSKMLELIEFALGDYACKLSNTVLTRKQGNSSNASPDIEQTKGKRLASIQETEQDDMVNVGRMKELSGGDKIYARGLFKDPIQFKPQFKMILLCNELPKINADDNGTWRRIRVVQFISKFTDNPKLENEYPIDHMLSEKIHKWKEAFVYLLLQLYKKYKKVGLKEPQEVLEVTREYQRVSDLYNDFITDNIAKKENCHIGLNETYRVFKDWFKNNSTQSMRPPTRTYFKGKMEQKLGQKYEQNRWTGFTLVDEEDEDEID